MRRTSRIEHSISTTEQPRWVLSKPMFSPAAEVA